MESKVFIRNWKEFLNDFKESSIIWSRLDDYVNLWDSKGKILKTVLVPYDDYGGMVVFDLEFYSKDFYLYQYSKTAK